MRLDPYVKVWLQFGDKRIEKRKTPIFKCTLNPVFNEAFSFNVPWEKIRECSLDVMVMDFDNIGRNELIGRIQLAGTVFFDNSLNASATMSLSLSLSLLLSLLLSQSYHYQRCRSSLCIYARVELSNNVVVRWYNFRKKRQWSERNETLARYDYEAAANDRTMASTKARVKV